MLQSLKQIKNRIRSVDNTKKVTHVMEMISIAKLKAAENRLLASKAYFPKIDSLLKHLLSGADSLSHPFLVERRVKEKIALCVIASDTGLCGVYNHEVLNAAEAFISKYEREKILLITVGKKASNHFRRKGLNTTQNFLDLHGRYSDEIASKILKTLTDIFLSGKADEVYVAYMHFETFSRQRPVIEKILNIDSVQGEKKIDYIVEPDINSVLTELIPIYISNKMKSLLLNAYSSEHTQRLIAMREATNNAEDLLKDLILSRNKVRQANITREIMEIVSSAEVLR